MSVSGFTRVLSWDNFTVVAKSKAPPAESETFSGFGFNSAFTQNAAKKFVINKAHFPVNTTMDTHKSWVVTGKKSADLLKHEQGHYDISALAARQFFDAALLLEADTAKELTAALNQLFSDTQTEMQSIQDVYDEDVNCGTQHGTDAHWQSDWVMRIKAAKGDPAGKLSDLATCVATP